MVGGFRISRGSVGARDSDVERKNEVLVARRAKKRSTAESGRPELRHLIPLQPEKQERSSSLIGRLEAVPEQKGRPKDGNQRGGRNSDDHRLTVQVRGAVHVRLLAGPLHAVPLIWKHFSRSVIVMWRSMGTAESNCCVCIDGTAVWRFILELIRKPENMVLNFYKPVRLFFSLFLSVGWSLARINLAL